MCYAGNCHPDCDNCKPKFLTCPDCSTKTLLRATYCPVCGHVVTEEDQENARADWQRKHPFSTPSTADFGSR